MKHIVTLAAALLLGTSARAGVVFVGVESGAPPSFQAQRWSLSTEKKNFAVTNNVFGGSGYYCLAPGADERPASDVAPADEVSDLSAQHPGAVDILRARGLAWVKSLLPAGVRAAVANRADCMKLLDFRKPQREQ